MGALPSLPPHLYSFDDIFGSSIITFGKDFWKQHFFSIEGPRRCRQMLLANESERHGHGNLRSSGLPLFGILPKIGYLSLEKGLVSLFETSKTEVLQRSSAIQVKLDSG